MNRFLLLFVLLFAKAEAQTSALAVADSLYAVGNYVEAIRQLEKVKPKAEKVYLKLAQTYQAQGNYSKALKSYKAVLQENPNRLITVVNYGKLLFDTHNLKSADSLFSSLIKKYPKNADFEYQLGKVKAAAKDSTYLKHYYKAIFHDKTHQKALREIAEYQLKRGYFPAAKKYALQGLETNPTNVALLSILAQTYFHQKEFEKAVVPFQKLISLGEANEFVHTSLGKAYYSLHKNKPALAQFNSALTFNPKNPATHYYLGNIYTAMGKFDKAEVHLQLAVLYKNPALDAEYLSLALLYKEQQLYKKALGYLKLALEENPENERALYERAIAADNYFADLQTRMNYYRAYLNKYETSGNKKLILLAKNRIQDIREELHMEE